ncbi:MAG: hypothetical protein JNN09_09545, partial [Alphaproteobacteria bacterium]|nr:hypothetical protein [Alphaproteobacteria bacterium]
MAKYVHKNGRFYWYIRKVPIHISEIDGRSLVKISLKTSVYEEAVTKARFLSKELEAAWDETIKTDHPVGDKKYKRLVNLAKMYGFDYKPACDIAASPMGEIVDRVKIAKKEK